MDNMPLNVVILGSIPESILVMALGLVMIGIKPSWRRLIIAAVIQGIIAYFVRRDVPFGVHVLYLYASFVFLTWLIVKVPFITSVFSNLLGVVLNSLVEGLYSIIALGLLDISFGEIMSRSWLRILIFTPKLLILLGILYLCIKYKFTLEEEFKVIKNFKGREDSF
ncbi:hypothetical protein [Alkaliphilus peptidifermentans]|uniref:Uncharacterized protein n=1 Tax=Alkaliphilus peptidifermentans DSM 18978 TaxID=1120976 RepID=A0A1G5IDT9_9FIRM|nr:hypothetical protein [Alkaliphilus peptidifermentans]SCY74256.1 hypothetical protein SAMN03080606_02366 [Alkaliphilus peptidifermentans DSM 18978]